MYEATEIKTKLISLGQSRIVEKNLTILRERLHYRDKTSSAWKKILLLNRACKDFNFDFQTTTFNSFAVKTASAD